ncbi:hypothetical protein ABXT06_02225 [Flavobacterium sp. UW10123]|uniref:hypothetical protein n=1 Tax=Flavobacterium sp. UW10123 TaxID=3230800 RepID=UPI0033976428
MSTKIPQDNLDQEIDIFEVSKSIGNFFDRINTKIFNLIQFFVRNRIIVLVLVLVGFGLGLLLDITQKKYKQEIIVAPNFDSTDYLYAKIDLIYSKIREDDTLFLQKAVGIQHPESLISITIKPISDVYRLIENKPENFELIKLMADNGDIKKIIEDNLTSKNYRYHRISILTNELADSKKITDPLLNFLNKTDFYKKIQEAKIANAKEKIIHNEATISQIDGVLKEFSAKANSSQKSNSLVYYNENTQLNDVIKTKGDLVNEQGGHRLELIGFDKIIKDISTTLNIEKKGIIYGHKKLIFPVLLVFLYVLLHFFKAFYRKQKVLMTEKTNV